MMNYCLKRMIKGMVSFILILACFQVQAQIGQKNYFKFNSPQPSAINYTAVSFADANNGIAVGYNGGISRTTDGGATWQYGIFTFVNNAGLTTKPNFNDCQLVTASIGYAVAKHGLVLKTTDGGLTWSRLNNPFSAAGNTSVFPAAVCFTSVTTGYIGGSPIPGSPIPKLYKTTNGGATWDTIPAPVGTDTTYFGPMTSPIKAVSNNKNKSICGIRFSSDNVGYICGTSNASVLGEEGGGALAASTTLLWKYDNGTLKDYSITKEKAMPYWAPPATGGYYSIVPCLNLEYWAIQPANDSIVIIGGLTTGGNLNRPAVFRVFTGVNDSTADFIHPGKKLAGRYELVSGNMGGKAPTNAAAFAGSGKMWRAAKAPDGKIYVQHEKKTMAVTADNGATWAKIGGLSATHKTNAIAVAANGRIVTVGQHYISDSLPTQPRRNIGTSMSTRDFFNTKAMEFADCDNGAAAGENKSLAVTFDGGKTWIDKSDADLLPTHFSFSGVSYKDPSKLYLVGSYGSPDVGLVYVSTDKGTTLDLILAPQNTAGFNNSVTGIDSRGDSIWVSGRRENAPSAMFENYVYRSFNGGNTWDTIVIQTGITSDDVMRHVKVMFTTKDTGYFYGAGTSPPYSKIFSHGQIFKTTNAGATWTNITPTGLPILPYGKRQSWESMCAVGKDTLFIAADNGGLILKSFDAGLTWTFVPVAVSTEPPITRSGSAVSFHDSKNGYVALGGGRIFITNDGGITWRADHSPINDENVVLAFTARNVPAGTPFENRKVYAASENYISDGDGYYFYEYGDPQEVEDIQSAESFTNATCTDSTAGSITINASGGIAPYTYSVDGGTFGTSNTFTGLTSGNHTITIKAAACGPTFTKTVTVGFTDNMTVDAGTDTEVCSGGSVQLNATAPAGSSYAWSPVTGLSATDINNPTATLTGSIGTTAVYTVTATLNSCVRTDQVEVKINKPSPAVNAGGDKTIVSGDQVQLDGTANNVVSIAWSPAATLTGDNTLTPIAKPSVTTPYTLTVVNSDGCTSTDETIVTVMPYCVKVMNAFTPNGDGINDKWLVTEGNGCTKQVSVKVFNRYGDIVYNNDNYNNDWTGTYKAKPVADATYYYLITYHLINGQVLTLKGDVTILR